MTNPLTDSAHAHHAEGRTNSASDQRHSLQSCPYPTWIYGFITILLYASVWSLVRLPESVEAARSLKIAEHYLGDGQLRNAAQSFKKTLSIDPTSAKARIGMALSLLSIDSEQVDDQAVDYLKDLALSASDRTKLRSAAPIKYHLYFSTRDDS
ncbi:MAG: hypothetical protein K2X93_23945 [Candidatus Obscuribacterales bacterium]|nr:hypothetical protein [Candidatus Obscuribacterales bacterium]